MMTDSKMKLSTAGGIVKAMGEAPVRMPMFPEIDVVILENSPNALSIPILCRCLGFSFSWGRWQGRPRLFNHEGVDLDERISLSHGVPFYDEYEDDDEPAFEGLPGMPAVAHPAAAAKSTTGATSKVEVDGNAAAEDAPSEEVEVPEVAEVAEAAEVVEVPAEEYDPEEQRPHLPRQTDRSETALRADAASMKHALLHMPKNVFCQACLDAKTVSHSHLKGGFHEHSMK